MLQQMTQMTAKNVRIQTREYQSGLSMLDHFRQSSRVRHNNRFTGDLRLHDGKRLIILNAGMYEDVRQSEHRRNVFAASPKDNIILQSKPGCLMLQVGAQIPVPYDPASPILTNGFQLG